MFEKWVYTFGREMIVLSSRHPLVSGFHKLLSICFQICKEISFFKVASTGVCPHRCHGYGIIAYARTLTVLWELRQNPWR